MQTEVNVSEFHKHNYDFFVLGGDIGGTNTRLGIAGVKNDDVEMIFSAQFRTDELKGNKIHEKVNALLKKAKEKFDIEVGWACLGVAGVVKNNRCSMTNINVVIDAKQIHPKTLLHEIKIINDFEAVGYGINTVKSRDLYVVKKSKPIVNKNIAVIGAGTGLGKSILVEKNGTYVPQHSEGGHSDFPVQDKGEIKIVGFIKKLNKIKTRVVYEDLVSGKGIENIYTFFRSKGKATKCTDEIDSSEEKAVLISKYCKKDTCCRKTMDAFVKFYARCAKNFCLETAAEGGLYLCQAIAIDNKKLFRSRKFVNEFMQSEKMKNLLKRIPIYIITNENIGLTGACFAAAMQKKR